MSTRNVFPNGLMTSGMIGSRGWEFARAGAVTPAATQAGRVAYVSLAVSLAVSPGRNPVRRGQPGTPQPGAALDRMVGGRGSPGPHPIDGAEYRITAGAAPILLAERRPARQPHTLPPGALTAAATDALQAAGNSGNNGISRSPSAGRTARPRKLPVRSQKTASR